MSYEKEQEKRENLGTHCNLASEHTLTKDTGIGNKHDILGVIPVTAGVFGTIIYQPLNPLNLKIKLMNNHFK